MSGWTSAINPFSTPKTVSDARRAARASALSIAISVAWGGWHLTDQLFGDANELLRTAMAQGMGDLPNAETMVEVMVPVLLGFTIAILIVQAALGLVQWFRPNFVIPILFLVFTIYGLGSMVRAFMIVHQMHMTVPEVPLWQTVAGWSVMAFQTVLHVAGLRGAMVLRKLQKT